jgi:hypothetical protein
MRAENQRKSLIINSGSKICFCGEDFEFAAFCKIAYSTCAIRNVRAKLVAVRDFTHSIKYLQHDLSPRISRHRRCSFHKLWEFRYRHRPQVQNWFRIRGQ